MNLRLVAGHALVALVVGCEDRQAKFRQEYDAAYPEVKPQIDALRKIADLKVDGPECTAAPAPQKFLAWDQEKLQELLKGTQISTFNGSFLSYNDACYGVAHASSYGLLKLIKPYDDKQSGSGMKGANMYLIAIDDWRKRYPTLESYAVVVPRTEVVAPKMNGGMFVPGSVTGEIRFYSKNGEPKCVKQITVRNRAVEYTGGGTNEQVERSLLANLDAAFLAEVHKFLPWE
jgi:hypothetical protein